MKIGFKILLGIVLSIIIAYIASSIKGEIPFVEGISGILIFLLPIISTALVIGLENPKEKTSRLLIGSSVIFTILLVVGLLLI